MSEKLELNIPDDALEGRLKHLGGSASDLWNATLVQQAGYSMAIKGSDQTALDRQVGATIAGLDGIAPRDELEGMMAAQLIAAHNAAMECYRRAMADKQTFEGRKENLNQANKLSRTWATLLDALNKHRGKGQQKVTVEHVHVHAGGQAVVGTIERPGGGDHTKTEEQPHAKQIENAPEPTLWREDAERRAVPIARDGERALPDARRKVPGRTNP
ncbi:hypothetical protein [Roseovarius mucosus]|uniref:hypothetical protein n=1 Tax=Roseovarius mucosus TaxID=215743 RepID=UPI003BAB69D0